MNAEKWHHSEISIAISDESQGSIAKKLRCDELLYYTFIIRFAGKIFFLKIGKHLAKLRAKSMTVSCTPFALHLCPLRCRSRQISWITCELQKLVLSVAMLTGRLVWVNYQEISNCCRPVLTYWLTDWRRQWLTDCWSCTEFCHDSFSLLRQLCTVDHGVFIWPM